MKYLVFLGLCCLPFFAFAQNEQEGKSKHLEIGLNTTQLLRNLFAQNPSGTNGPYSLFMKYGGEKGYFRILLGGNVANVENNSEFNGTFVSNTSVFRTSLGYERRKPIYKKLELVLGFDVILGANRAHSSSKFFNATGSSEFIVDRNSVSIGGGPILGLRYAFSQYFAISTESTLYAIARKGSSVNRTNGVDEDRKEFTDLVVKHSLPTDLFFVVTF